MNAGRGSTSRSQQPWWDFLIPVAVITALAIVAWDLLVVKGMNWHLSQPSAVEGGIEALALLGCLALAAARRRRGMILMAVAVTLVFLRRHNAELTLLSGLFIMESLYAIGAMLRRTPGAKAADPAGADIFPAFIAGTGAWVLAVATLSLFSLATPAHLGWLLLAIGIAAIAAHPNPLCIQLFRALRSRPRSDCVKASLLLGWLLILMARTANVIGHDTVWYLGQGDRLLAPGGSIFQPLSLVAPVHYFPKLWEVLLLPLTSFDQLRPQTGLAIAVGAVFWIALWQLATQLGITRRWRWWALWIIATLPAVANTALTLKSDTLCALFMAVMCLQLLDWFQRRRAPALGYALAAAALACSTKLTAIPYVGMGFIVLVAHELTHSRMATGWRPEKTAAAAEPVRAVVITTTLALLAALVLLARTWALAGVPTIGPDALLSLWNALGMHIAEPAGTLNWTRPQDWSDVPALFHDWLFAPSTMPKMPIGWTGNIWAVLSVLSLAAAAMGREPRGAGPPSPWSRVLLLVLALTGLLLAIAWRYHSRGSDGNYFMLPVALATLLAMRAASSRLGDAGRRTGAILATTLLLTGLVHATHSFISAGWGQPGTRPFDSQFGKTPFETGAWRERILQRAGVSGIARRLASRPAWERGIGFDPRDEQYFAALPIAVEEIRNIGYSRPAYVRDGGALLEFMDLWGIQHVVLPPDEGSPPAIADYRRALLAAGWLSFGDAGATLYSRPGAFSGQ